MISSNEIIKLLKKNNLYSSYGINMISFFIYCITINMFIALFTICFYFIIKKIIGGKGLEVISARKGFKVKMIFAIYVPTNQKYKKEVKRERETLEVDEPVKMEILNKEIKGGIKLTMNFHGDSKYCKKCKTHNYVYQPDIKYLTGVIANFNENKQVIENIQFVYKNTKNETKLMEALKEFGVITEKFKIYKKLYALLILLFLKLKQCILPLIPKEMQPLMALK